jgi:hypothetical protein
MCRWCVKKRYTTRAACIRHEKTCHKRQEDAAINENTTEVVTKISSVEQNISPVEDNTSNDSFESTLTNHDGDCSCQETSESDHDVSPVNNEEGFKSFDLSDFVADDEADSKEASNKQDQFSDDLEAEDEDLPKNEVILNILSQLDPQAVNQVC